MGAIFGPVILVLIVIVVAVVLLKRTVRDEKELSETLAGPEVPSLRYRVPEGQDPASVLSALRSADFVATADDQGAGDQGVLIGGPDGTTPDREAVRAVIARSPLNAEGDPGGESRPRFDDE